MDKVELRRAVISRRDAVGWMCGRQSPPLSVRGLLSCWIAWVPRRRASLPSMPRWVPKSTLPRLPQRPPNAACAWPIHACSRQLMQLGQRMCMRAVAADDASAAPFIATTAPRAFAATDIDSSRFLSCLLRLST